MTIPQTVCVTLFDGQPTAPPTTPQGRLTLVSDTPVMTSSQSAATTIYYSPYSGNQVLINGGAGSMLSVPFTELSNITTNSSTGNAGPAAVAANSNYDLFVWLDDGTVRLTRGPAWSSDTARGTGAGTTELQRVVGIWTNKAAITNGPGVNLGVYLGTVRSNGSSQIDFIYGGIGSGGTAASLGVWNTYNRVDVRGLVGDSTNSWTYSTATWRAANNSANMRVSFVVGLQEDFFQADYSVITTCPNGADHAAAIGYDSTTAMSGRAIHSLVLPGGVGQPWGTFNAQPLGFHYMQAIEQDTSGAASGTLTWYGTNGSAGVYQNGLTYVGRF